VPSPVSTVRAHLDLRLLARRRRRFERTLMAPGDLVFDIGANVGDRTAGYRRLDARVVAVEPQSECVATLRRRFADDGDVTVVAAGLGAAPGTAEIAICSDAPVLSTMSTAWQEGRFADYTWDRTETVAVRTLDELLAEHGTPAFCKIDVEGFEVEVLRGLSRPLPALSLEWTSEGLDRAREALELLLALSPQTQFNLAVGEEPALVLERWSTPEAVLERARAEGTNGWGDVFARWSG
jgi:FkbM family methyltransferase